MKIFNNYSYVHPVSMETYTGSQAPLLSGHTVLIPVAADTASSRDRDLDRARDLPLACTDTGYTSWTRGYTSWTRGYTSWTRVSL